MTVAVSRRLDRNLEESLVKLSSRQEDLSRGLQVAGRAVAQRSPLPITSNVLFEAEAGKLKLTGTNLEIAITTWVDAEIADSGRITLPSRLVTEFVNALPNESVTLEVKAGTQTCHLAAGRFEADIRGMDAEDFPRIPSPEDQPTAHIDARMLREMIDQVAFAAATDDTRPVLTGVQCLFSESELTMAAADSFRMAIRTGSVANAAAGDFSVIIPARTLLELSKILPDAEANVDITVTPNRSQIVFRTDNLLVVSRLLEGTFPNVKQLVPTRFQTTATVSTAEFLKAARVASFFSRDNSNMITLELAPSNSGSGSMTVTGSAAEVGENHGELDAHVEGEAVKVAFNARYVQDALNAIQAPQVGLELTGRKTAAVIRPADTPSHTHVVMPIDIEG
jgi:DNA polymerase-3 subunit beta